MEKGLTIGLFVHQGHLDFYQKRYIFTSNTRDTSELLQVDY